MKINKHLCASYSFYLSETHPFLATLRILKNQNPIVDEKYAKKVFRTVSLLKMYNITFNI